MLCHVFWSQVEYKIVYFIYICVVLDVDWPKTCVFKRKCIYYWFPPSPTGKRRGVEDLRETNKFTWTKNAEVLRRIKWCLDNVCVTDVLPMDDFDGVCLSLRSGWKYGNESVQWTDVMEDEWNASSNFKMVTKGGQTISLNGLLGMCHDMEPNQCAKMLMCTSRDSGDSLRTSLNIIPVMLSSIE